MTDEETIKGKQLRNVQIEGDEAIAQSISSDGISSDSVFFTLESEVWKIQLTQSLPSTEKTFNQMLVESNTSEKLCVKSLVENITGKPLKSKLCSSPE